MNSQSKKMLDAERLNFYWDNEAPKFTSNSNKQLSIDDYFAFLEDVVKPYIHELRQISVFDELFVL